MPAAEQPGRSSPATCPMQRRLEVGRQARRRCVGCRRQRPYDHPAPLRQMIHVRPHQMPEAPLDAIANNGRADRSADDEPHLRRTAATRIRQHVNDQVRPAGFGAKADGRRKVLAVAHAMDRSQQRRLRPTASRGPCAGGSPGWRDRHAYACGDGSRAYGHDDDCWAGKCACSRVVPHAGGGVIFRPSRPSPGSARRTGKPWPGNELSTATARSQISAL